MIKAQAQQFVDEARRYMHVAGLVAGAIVGFFSFGFIAMALYGPTPDIRILNRIRTALVLGAVLGAVVGLIVAEVKRRAYLEEAKKQREVKAAIKERAEAARRQAEQAARLQAETTARQAEADRQELYRKGQEDYRQQLVVLGEQAIGLFESIPGHLTLAEEHLDQADADFTDGALAPFWDSIERAAQTLAAFDDSVRQITGNLSRYTGLVTKCETAPPPFPLHVLANGQIRPLPNV
jgi:hypothetical protein